MFSNDSKQHNNVWVFTHEKLINDEWKTIGILREDNYQEKVFKEKANEIYSQWGINIDIWNSLAKKIRHRTSKRITNSKQFTY